MHITIYETASAYAKIGNVEIKFMKFENKVLQIGKHKENILSVNRLDVSSEAGEDYCQNFSNFLYVNPV